MRHFSVFSLVFAAFANSSPWPLHVLCYSVPVRSYPNPTALICESHFHSRRSPSLCRCSCDSFLCLFTFCDRHEATGGPPFLSCAGTRARGPANHLPAHFLRRPTAFSARVPFPPPSPLSLSTVPASSLAALSCSGTIGCVTSQPSARWVGAVGHNDSSHAAYAAVHSVFSHQRATLRKRFSLAHPSRRSFPAAPFPATPRRCRIQISFHRLLVSFSFCFAHDPL